ncbi:mandelate racemase/muconate lactonizing enzyme family protein [Amycolatopsis palatopharyngis]|uniref:mandelate racemase/muconate lactonizing enzyme family protein n=1 Tax=Amycolatopsis palatopharyngis TaxID=187982 RepID=UPI000E21FCD5|nr:mandelate racemase/muconate lactonizing enzyme family protein [Amycolatopsis palatopharyngis]
MAIARVWARAASVPVSKPTRMSTRVLGRRDYLLVHLETEDGERGLGYAYVGTAGGTVAVQAVHDLLAPILTGADPDDIAALWEQMYQDALLTGRRGIVIRALSAVDIALWDLSAKRRKLPLGVLLGGSRKPLPAYASGGYYRPDEGPWADAVAREIEGNRKQGFRDHKIKVGGLAVHEDAERVAAAVAALGADGRLALDCNNAYRTATEARRAIRAFEEAAGVTGLWWVEEPLSPEDVEGHARLVDSVQSPIATGEVHQTRWDFRDLLQRRAADILQPDAGVLGGVTEWMRVAHAAEVFSVPVAPHWHANLHVHLAAATPGCMTIEYFSLEKDIFNFERLVREDTRLSTMDGYVTMPDRPGIGIELDDDAVRHFAVNP